jgi:hypothetical protein
MATFRLGCQVTVSATTIVEAETLAEAIEIAKMRQVVISTGHNAYGADDDWVIEDADGSPVDIRQE